MQAIWEWLTTGRMTTVIIYGLLISAVLFIASIELYRELAVIPLAWLIAFGMSGILYAIDRWGFWLVDTLDMVADDPSLYRWWVVMYWANIIVAHVAAYIIVGI